MERGVTVWPTLGGHSAQCLEGGTPAAHTRVRPHERSIPFVYSVTPVRVHSCCLLCVMFQRCLQFSSVALSCPTLCDPMMLSITEYRVLATTRVGVRINRNITFKSTTQRKEFGPAEDQGREVPQVEGPETGQCGMWSREQHEQHCGPCCSSHGSQLL